MQGIVQFAWSHKTDTEELIHDKRTFQQFPVHARPHQHVGAVDEQTAHPIIVASALNNNLLCDVDGVYESECVVVH